MTLRTEAQTDLKKEYEDLIKKEKSLDEELEKLDREMAKKEMNLLHMYNEVKDATQIILAALAKFEGVTVKKIHERKQLQPKWTLILPEVLKKKNKEVNLYSYKKHPKTK